MKLGQLKNALRRLPPDMDDLEVMVVSAEGDKSRVESLCFTGYLPREGHEAIALGTWSAVKQMVESGDMPKPEGYDELVDGFED